MHVVTVTSVFGDRLQFPRTFSSMSPAAPKQAVAAKKAALKGTQTVTKKTLTSSSFHRPKTLKLNRTPKYPRKSVPSKKTLDAFRVVRSPLATETALRCIEDRNTLVLLCDVRANKRQIKEAVKVLLINSGSVWSRCTQH
jgi:large subunit ribosomal protein L23Ae